MSPAETEQNIYIQGANTILLHSQFSAFLNVFFGHISPLLGPQKVAQMQSELDKTRSDYALSVLRQLPAGPLRSHLENALHAFDPEALAQHILNEELSNIHKAGGS